MPSEGSFVEARRSLRPGAAICRRTNAPAGSASAGRKPAIRQAVAGNQATSDDLKNRQFVPRREFWAQFCPSRARAGHLS